MTGRLWTFFQREGEDTMSDYPTGYHESGESTSSRRSRRPVIAFLFVIIFLSGTFFGWTLNGLLPRAFHQTSVSQTPVEQQYPAFLVSTPPATPRAGLPYTAQTVFRAFHTTGIHVSDIISSYGWDCCVTYQPEGDLIGWEESYAVVLEIATFATPNEAKTDATDLLKNSYGYSVITRNLCLFFYDSSISQVHLAIYTAVLSRMCS